MGVTVYEASSEAGGFNTLSLLLQEGNVKAGWWILLSKPEK